MSLNHYPFPTTCLLLSAFQSDTTFFIILFNYSKSYPEMQADDFERKMI